MKEQPQYIALDIDGCLIPSRELPLDYLSFERFRSLSSVLPIGFSSGRSQGFVEALSRLYATRLPCICEWGGLSFDPASYTVLVNPEIPNDFLLATSHILAALASRGINVQPKLTALTLYPGANYTLSSLERIATHALAEHHIDANVNMRVTRTHIDITYGGVNKGQALRWLCQTLAIDPLQVLAVGDDESDLPMFEVAGMTACPANSTASAKSNVGFVSQLEGTAGVVEILERFAPGCG